MQNLKPKDMFQIDDFLHRITQTAGFQIFIKQTIHLYIYEYENANSEF